jgi:hypothetical protein
MPMTIDEALKALDKTNTDHWTADGSPRMEVLQELTGDPALTRRKVLEAAPGFTRETAADPVSAEPGLSPATEQGSVAQPLAEIETEIETETTDQANDASLDDPDEEEDDLEDVLAIAEEELAVAEAELNERRKVVEALVARRDKLIAARDRERTPHDDQVERMRFIAMQHSMRLERAGQKALANDLALSARGMTAASPLDQSMARRSGRGFGRPAARPLRV